MLLAGCSPEGDAADALPGDAGGGVDARPDLARPPRIIQPDRVVSVTLDGAPQAGVVVSQGGNPARWLTGPDGTAAVHVDVTIPGDIWMMASHAEARIGSVAVSPNGPLAISLVRFVNTDNRDYRFQDPGTPQINGDTSYCAHCHVTLNADWYQSPHRRSASNAAVHDLYAGAAAALSSEKDCLAASGQWRRGKGPGTGMPAMRCYLGAGTLQDLNPGCDQAEPCDGKVNATGACADCHAPGIDGVAGGRDLLDATGRGL